MMAKHIAGSSSGRMRLSGSRHLGSNPSPAARIKLVSFGEYFWGAARSAA